MAGQLANGLLQQNIPVSEEQAAGVTITPKDGFSIDYMTPIENVALTAKKDALPMLLRLGLTTEETKRNVMKLSGGQQQRVAIARALASDTPVILADEPTGNLDEDTAGEIAGLLKESAHELNKCMIVVTHSNELAAKADVVLYLKCGSIHTA